jgi:hypothetical protein
MTGVPVFDAVIDFINFVRMIAGIGIVICGAIIVIGIIGSFAAPYSGWGLFVRRYTTGDERPWGYSPMWVCGVVLLVCLAVWFGLPRFGAQTLPRFP